jgi:AraC family transcriptional regulator
MVTRLQIEEAKRLMRRSVPLREVATRCGFRSQSHFTSRFKQTTGTPPGRWVRTSRKRGAERNAAEGPTPK